MTELQLFQTIAYFIFMFAIVAYAALDGFDLGVGCLHLFVKKDDERRIFLNAIGPVWDGNSVWIVVTGGVLLAAFPRAFATLLPTFYLPVMFVLAGFMFRAVAIEFRSKRTGQRWKQVWDVAFSISSIVLTLGLGAVLGNLIYGFPLDKSGELIAHEHTIFHPYALLVAVFGLSTFMLHGCMFLIMKTEGQLQQKLQSWVIYLTGSFLIMWIITTVATFFFESRLMERFKMQPWTIIFVLIALLAIISVPILVRKKQYGWGFLASMGSISSLLLLFAIGNFPYLMIGYNNLGSSLTIYNSSSSLLTLKIVLIIALLGVLLSGFYISYLYKVFRGKVEIDHTSY